jgi:hypothetical protein
MRATPPREAGTHAGDAPTGCERSYGSGPDGGGRVVWGPLGDVTARLEVLGAPA